MPAVTDQESHWYGECMNVYRGRKWLSPKGTVHMRAMNNEQDPRDWELGVQEIRECLEQEQGTARRQQLLKALWKLSQQRKQVDRTADAGTINASPTTPAKETAKSSAAGQTLTVSC
jgi:hypothetical protein